MNPLVLSRSQILSYRRRAGALDQRLPPSADALRAAAFAGLQDSMPRAAMLSIHARMEGTRRDVWEEPGLVQLWGPRFNVYAVAKDDIAVFSLGTMPDHAKGLARATELAARLENHLAGTSMPYDQAGAGLGVNPNALRYAAATGTVLIRWEGAGCPAVWTVPPPGVDPREARLELARRYLHVFGPTTPESFGRWAGIGGAAAQAAFRALSNQLLSVETPIGPAWMLEQDVPTAGVEALRPAPVRLLPSGDAYFLAWGRDRELLVEDSVRRAQLWTSRVWPGALLIEGEITGTWRRAGTSLVVQSWRSLSPGERDAVAAEAELLRLPTKGRRVAVRFED
ncbi:MAG: winged helix DNA-binding domain-containing protein [Actinomycetota bacterium]|nr:winged helix DNA-binding domain-containing protein [Actinomycetota bacterium]